MFWRITKVYFLGFELNWTDISALISSMSSSTDEYRTLRRIDFDGIFITSEKTLGIECSLYTLSGFPPLCDTLGTVSFFQLPADTRYFVLAGQKDENAPRRQSSVNFGHFTDSIAHII